MDFLLSIIVIPAAFWDHLAPAAWQEGEWTLPTHTMSRDAGYVKSGPARQARDSLTKVAANEYAG